MTQDEALKEVLLRFKVKADLVGYVDDDTTQWTPNPGDLEIIELVLGHKPTEDDLWFMVGGYGPSPDYYVK